MRPGPRMARSVWSRCFQLSRGPWSPCWMVPKAPWIWPIWAWSRTACAGRRVVHVGVHGSSPGSAMRARASHGAVKRPRRPRPRRSRDMICRSEFIRKPAIASGTSKAGQLGPSFKRSSSVQAARNYRSDMPKQTMAAYVRDRFRPGAMSCLVFWQAPASGQLAERRPWRDLSSSDKRV